VIGLEGGSATAMITLLKHIHPLTNIRRERVVPVSGQVITRRMQKVTPTDIIVTAPLAPQYLLLDIARGLNVSPSRADELLQRQPGDDLSKGDVIAGPVGLFQRVIRAPENGVIRIAGEGKVLFEISAEEYELPAGMDGTVTGIIPDRGAIIETKGALIQGIWGNGRIAYGVIQPISKDLSKEVESEQIDISFRGAIMAAGSCSKAEVLEAAAAVPIKGLILGSMSASLIPTAKSMSYPIMVIDGFGSIPMNNRAEQLLVTNRDRNIALNAQRHQPYRGKYPEVIISLPIQKDFNTPVEAEELIPGQRVIMISGARIGKIGTVARLLEGKFTFASGVAAPAIEIEMEGGAPVIVPANNVRLLSSQEY